MTLRLSTPDCLVSVSLYALHHCRTYLLIPIFSGTPGEFLGPPALLSPGNPQKHPSRFFPWFFHELSHFICPVRTLDSFCFIILRRLLDPEPSFPVPPI